MFEWINDLIVDFSLKEKRKRLFWDFYCFILIPVYTILFTTNTNWFTMNFSVIGYHLDRKFAFVVWGILISIFDYYMLDQLLKKSEDKSNRFKRFCLNTTQILLIFAVTTPYLPQEMPLKSFLHIIFAFFSALMLLLCIKQVIDGLFKHKDKKLYFRYMCGLGFIVYISFLLLVLVGIVSTVLEIFITVSTSFLLRFMWYRVAYEI